jgi:hypothetical protein
MNNLWSVIVGLIALALLIHECLWYSSKGSVYFTESLAPVFNLRLQGNSLRLLHGCFIAVNLTLIVFQSQFLVLVDLLLLLLIIASYSVRLSNHLLAAVFFLGPLAWYGPNHIADATSIIRLVMVTIYFMAGFHKLNWDYLNPDISCATVFLRKLTGDGMFLRVLRLLCIWMPIAVELALPLLLILPATGRMGILIALGFHIVMAISFNPHFSVFMLPGLLSFIGHFEYHFAPGQLVAVGTVTLLLLLIGTHRKFFIPKLAWMVQSFVVSLLIVTWMGVTIMSEGITHLSWAAGAVWMLFLLNATAPYFGWKYEFSLSMFSNMRPGVFRHVFVKWSLIDASRYVSIDSISGLEEISGLHPRSYLREAISKLRQYETLQYDRYYLQAVERTLNEHGMYPVIEYENKMKKAWPIALFPAFVPKQANEPFCF